MRPQDLARLVALAAVWGASYLFMRYAVPQLGPVRMIAIREQAVANGRGQTALRGYGSVPARPPAGVRINSAR